ELPVWHCGGGGDCGYQFDWKSRGIRWALCNWISADFDGAVQGRVVAGECGLGSERNGGANGAGASGGSAVVNDAGADQGSAAEAFAGRDRVAYLPRLGSSPTPTRQERVGVRTGPSQRDFSFNLLYSALKRWAKLGRPS